MAQRLTRPQDATAQTPARGSELLWLPVGGNANRNAPLLQRLPEAEPEGISPVQGLGHSQVLHPVQRLEVWLLVTDTSDVDQKTERGKEFTLLQNTV